MSPNPIPTLTRVQGRNLRVALRRHREEASRMLRTMEIHDVPETALHDTLRDLVDTLARFETRIKEDLDGGTT